MLRINWVTTALSSAVLWTFIVWNLTHGDSNDYVSQGKSWVTANWTWFYIVTQDLWFMFVLYLLFTKYKDVKLGRDDEEQHSAITNGFPCFSLAVSASACTSLASLNPCGTTAAAQLICRTRFLS